MKNNPVPNDLISRKEAAQLEGIHLSTLKRLLARGHVRRWRRLGRVLVSRAEVHEALLPKLVSA